MVEKSAIRFNKYQGFKKIFRYKILKNILSNIQIKVFWEQVCRKSWFIYLRTLHPSYIGGIYLRVITRTGGKRGEETSVNNTFENHFDFQRQLQWN